MAQGTLDEVKTKMRGEREYRIIVKVIGTMPKLTHPLITDAVYHNGSAVIKAKTDIRDEIAIELVMGKARPDRNFVWKRNRWKTCSWKPSTRGSDMRPELIVAEKEFRDHITSKRFIVIFGIMMLLAVYAITTGTDVYNQKLEEYKNPQLSPGYQNQQLYMNQLQKHDRRCLDLQLFGRYGRDVAGSARQYAEPANAFRAERVPEHGLPLYLRRHDPRCRDGLRPDRPGKGRGLAQVPGLQPHLPGCHHQRQDHRGDRSTGQPPWVRRSPSPSPS